MSGGGYLASRLEGAEKYEKGFCRQDGGWVGSSSLSECINIIGLNIDREYLLKKGFSWSESVATFCKENEC